ncbi:SEC-C domain-containing protein [Drancourtella massiliensis]|uniref:SEC-C domain-containing protein n=2 Tax=Clostridia TaxID=186801 RepID=A0ABS2EE07_9FIRM|nr:SEC-C metal-binding domain-containing protein [Drancourtella massiliensis]MBM6743211.1 SEC-C domain-containing protein [Drancourtella massiliensis]
MKTFQIKLAEKKTKPPVWKRCIVPGGITFSQLAVILEAIAETEVSEQYEFEFYQAGIQLREWREGEQAVRRYNFDYWCSSDTYIDDLMGREPWFTFRTGKEKEYRVTIEKCVTDEKPYPYILKQKESSDSRTWMDVEKANQELRGQFQVTYGDPDYRTFDELKQEMKTGSFGLRGAEKPVSRTERNEKSSETKLREFADLLQKHLAENRNAQERYTRNPEMAEIMSSWTKEELKSLAEDLELKGYHSLKKDILVGKIKEELLKPSVMERQMMMFSDEEITAFESVLKTTGYYPVRKDLELLEGFYNLAYAGIYNDNFAAVPDEVKKIYKKVNTPKFRKKRKRAFWMIRCLTMVIFLYVLAPISVIKEMLVKCLGEDISEEEFREIFAWIPDYQNPCVIRGEWVIYKEVLPQGLYNKIKESQGDLEYYIPEQEEILDYTGHGYPSRDTCCRKVKEFLIKRMKIEEEQTENLMQGIYSRISLGGGPSDVTEIFEEEGIIFPNETTVRDFIALLIELNNSTRMIQNRGWTPSEMTKKRPVLPEGQKPTIVPMSSLAAEQLKQASNELQQMGFTVDLDSGADEVETVFMPDGIAGHTVKGTKKIYPNDPCPCGSGKKYKKCCGKSKKG